MIIDFHNHYYPPGYLKALQAGESSVKVTMDDQGNPRLYYPGDYNIAVPGQRDLNVRRKMLDDFGIDMQVYTMTTPGTHVESPAVAVRLASMVNDEFAEGIAAHPRRFTVFQYQWGRAGRPALSAHV
jgi:aminocarboxymuconate-semialdehyde decarboxylase